MECRNCHREYDPRSRWGEKAHTAVKSAGTNTRERIHRRKNISEYANTAEASL